MTVALSSITGVTAAIITASEIASMPFEASEGTPYSQPANDASASARIMPTLTEETNLGNMIDLFV